jgi:RNA polymerase sigma-70 factor (ECF subfamily)
MEQTDEQLIADYQQGNASALAVLIERHYASIYSYIYRYVRSLPEAEDIVQETFIKVWRQIHRFQEGSGLRPWLFRIARNTAIDYLRKKKSIPFSHFGEEGEVEMAFADTTINILEETIAQEQKDQLNAAVEHLAIQYREVLVLRAEDNLTFEEIATVLGKPLNTVKSLYRRGLQALQKSFTDLQSAPNNTNKT